VGVAGGTAGGALVNGRWVGTAGSTAGGSVGVSVTVFLNFETPRPKPFHIIFREQKQSTFLSSHFIL